MKKTARVIVTLKCNRNCPGCCNMNLPEYREVHTDEELLDYEEIVITGGEPMLIPGKVLEFINRMWDKGYRGKMYLYTSYWNGKGISKEILKELDGFTFTLHAECTDADIIALKNLSNSGVLQDKGFSSRLVIDKRVYDRYDLSNINFSRWSMVSWLIIAWKMVRCHMEIQTTESIMAIRRRDAKPMTALGC